MEGSERADDFIPAALASLGIAADETDLAVMAAAHQMFWPPILELLEMDTGAAPAEPAPDLSQPPPSP